MLEWSIKWLTLYITDATFDNLDFTTLMWFLQFNKSSRNLLVFIIGNDSNILLMVISAK